MKALSLFGSSPRTWGTRGRGGRRAARRRFIPTHVGNTRNLRIYRYGYVGSSPRTWGTQAQIVGEPIRRRFIPTHVGNTCTYCIRRIASSGSSPRTWGTPLAVGSAPIQGRFIPTHVGNTHYAQRSHDALMVHPHARGEHAEMPDPLSGELGSSPRTWGTLFKRRNNTPRLRFIPTHVGNTTRNVDENGQPSVHPHARGEHAADTARQERGAGSSPRTWGTLVLCRAGAACVRFIPTHVGNT